ncbi:type IV secretion system protein VirB10 [Shewanella sp. 202IG2-18]|uniref:type IV secretion system protein VirB10 n=1 Tax=Parashewanella hymeniacidonis TaxID=2807618 RepID=UPI001960B11B|nr:type IV secretion system protein VirB10 [Parashewanella hymeniacidonis]MBM7070732.1 type IV secretion system protein VirB10 [Parashewanella hymeniacidonis]
MSDQPSFNEAEFVNPEAAPELNAGQVRQTLSKPLMATLSIIIIVLLVWINGGFSSSKASAEQQSSNKSIGNHLGNPPDLPKKGEHKNGHTKPDNSKPEILHTGLAGLVSTPVTPVTPTTPTYASASQRQHWTPKQRKQFDKILVVNQAEQGITQQQEIDTANTDNTPQPLQAKLQVTKLNGTVASRVIDPNLFITKGAFLDCVLETAISSDVPGMTRCQLSRDIYSANGKVLLLEKGSHIVGQYQGGLQQGGLQQGIARIFVVWQRIETPNGVLIDLDSPGTDTLGRSGHSGFIDGHFKQRFGSAILLSLIGDAGSYAANKANSGTNNQIQFGNTIGSSKDLAAIALQDSIRIKPTLLKNQGEHINVFVARDLDFRSVYELQLSH